ncbi:MAG: putative DNA binding domain-containing protein [Selenomonadaceae bacterium]|nr:putative DNA binding domain-containing protein [Selenomonadaceae bacterium]
MNLGIETEVQEFKKTTGELKEGIISLGSMLNKHGYGTLYFGVKDNGDVIGQQIGNSTLRDISQAVANHLKPQVIPTISLELMEEKNVIKVYVEGQDIPYSAHGKYYIRSADEDRELSPRQLRSLMLKVHQVDTISQQPNREQKLSFKMLRGLFVTNNLTINNNNEFFETNLGLKLDNGQYNIMAGLLADQNDISIKIATFRGRDKSQLVRRNEYGYKCLLVAMDQVLNYMESINDTAVEIKTHGRVEEKLFDMLCFREAWINACLHTKWEFQNPPTVYIYQDRIEIISTGGLPEALSKEEFFKGISRPVNAKLQKIFGQLNYVEQTGHGIPLIVGTYGKQAFDIMTNYINVTLPFNKAVKPLPDGTSDLNDSQRKIFTLLKRNPAYTIKDLVQEAALSDGYVRKILTELKAKDCLQRVGSNKKGYWQTSAV